MTTSSVSSKELLYIADSCKNEELIGKLAASGMLHSRSPELKQKLAQIAQARVQNTQQLIHIMEQNSMH